jgi:hypothetical protein
MRLWGAFHTPTEKGLKKAHVLPHWSGPCIAQAPDLPGITHLLCTYEHYNRARAKVNTYTWACVVSLGSRGARPNHRKSAAPVIRGRAIACNCDGSSVDAVSILR